MNPVQSDFARVYSEHVPLIYAFLAYRLSNRPVAEDLTEATFERALRAWGRFDPRRGSERAWLLAIARNLLIDNYRRDRAGRTEQITEDTTPTVPGPEARIADTGDLGDALATLSDRDREILALRFGGDLDGAEIADRLGLSLANVHQISSRSLRKLRGLLEAPSGAVLQARPSQ
jgi:RNA polymerase sigma factor (sigma-70 family)